MFLLKYVKYFSSRWRFKVCLYDDYFNCRWNCFFVKSWKRIFTLTSNEAASIVISREAISEVSAPGNYSFESREPILATSQPTRRVPLIQQIFAEEYYEFYVCLPFHPGKHCYYKLRGSRPYLGVTLNFRRHLLGFLGTHIMQ